MAPKTVKIPAGSRYTLRVNDHAGPNLQLSTRVKFISGDVGIVAERPDRPEAAARVAASSFSAPTTFTSWTCSSGERSSSQPPTASPT